MNKFWKPLKTEYKWNPHGILQIIGALGIIPAMYVAYSIANFWLSVGSFLLWYFLVYLTYLTYCYFKKK